MPGFLAGLFSSGSRDDVGSAVSRVVSGSPNASAKAGIGQQEWDIDRAVKDGIEKVIWAFRCVDAIATNASDVPINIVKGYNNTKQEVIDDARLWKLLNVKPNSYESAQEFRYRLSAQLLLSRRGAFIEVVPANDNKPSELHLLPAGRVQPIPDPKTFVSGFKIQDADWREYTLPPERVIWLRYKPHPTDPYMALTPFKPASLAMETDYFARLFNNTFLSNDGRPSMIVSVRGNLGPEDADELKRRFQGSPSQAGSVSVVEADGIDIADLTANPRDIQWLEGIRQSKEDIMLAFGVPESILGNASGRTFDNADAEYEIFWVHTMVPHCKSIATKLDSLTGSTDDELMFAYAFDKVPVLQRMEERRIDRKKEEFMAGLCTVDEYLEATGRPAWDVIGTRVLYLPSGIAVAKNPNDQAAIMTLRPLTGPQPPDPTAAARQGALQGIEQGASNLNNVLAARALALSSKSQEPVELKVVDAEVVDDQPFRPTDPHAVDRAALEGQIDGLLLGMSSRQAKVYQDRLSHRQARTGTRHWEGSTGTKALNSAYVTDINQWADEATSDIKKAIMPVVMKVANNAAREMASHGAISGPFANTQKSSLGKVLGPNPDLAVETELAPVYRMIRNAVANQSDRVKRAIEAIDAAGGSIEDMKKKVDEMIGNRSAWRKQLSINATTSALELTKEFVYGKSGTAEKTWRSQHDEKVRPTHMKVDGKTMKANKKFRVGASYLDVPGDPKGAPGETVNCRCWLDWSVA